jgi:hypothetical protein
LAQLDRINDPTSQGSRDSKESSKEVCAHGLPHHGLPPKFTFPGPIALSVDIPPPSHSSIPAAVFDARTRHQLERPFLSLPVEVYMLTISSEPVIKTRTRVAPPLSLLPLPPDLKHGAPECTTG